MLANPTSSFLRQASRPVCRSRCFAFPFSQHDSRRTFLSTPGPQTITHSARLPYRPSDLYALIADIPSYPTFLPFCTTATVLRWSLPDGQEKRWPARATLGIGWGGIQEEYESRVYCVPNRVVEAVAGQAKTDLSNEELQHYKGISGMGVGIPGQRTDVLEGGDVFKALRTRWELTEAEVDGKQGSNVDLQIEFEFNNPLYAAVSGAAVPKVAGVVVSAFEKRARAVLGQE